MSKFKTVSMQFIPGEYYKTQGHKAGEKITTINQDDSLAMMGSDGQQSQSHHNFFFM